MREDKPEVQTALLEATANVAGSGAIAQGDNPVAAGAGSVVFINRPAADAIAEKALREAYLRRTMVRCGYLSLAGIDPAVAGQPEKDTQLSLNAVYTALLTGSSYWRSSALEDLDRHERLVLQGDPGSGKSTFVNFVALCLAGEILRDPQANLQSLTAPLPDEDGNDSKERQPWRHGALLPVLVILRDFAATGLPALGEKANADHLWAFIAHELKSASLENYASYLKKELLERGSLLLLDGLDEVPEAEQRREQVKQAVEDFVDTFGNCRVLVTSRTYAYRNQGWRLKGFNEATLAPFTNGQIRRFVSCWYEHTANLGRLCQQDASGRAELLKQAIFNRPTLHELAQRPLLLTLMASLHAWRGGNLPEKREQLYADAVELLLDRWDQRLIRRHSDGSWVLKQLSVSEYLKIGKDKVQNVLAKLAFEAHCLQPDLRGTADLDEKTLAWRLMELTDKTDVNPNRLKEYLRDRAGLLYPRGVGVYTFPHRSFQEYLAACYLTEEEDYPDKIAELARADRDRWWEVALLAGAKAARGAAASLWLLVEALCPSDPDAATERADAWGAQIAVEALIEIADLSRLSYYHQPKLKRFKRRLIQLMCDLQLHMAERMLAGDSLARLGDSRPGVGLKNGLPDLLWVRIPGTATVRASGRFPNFTELRLGNDAKLDSEADSDENWPENAEPMEITDFELAAYPLTIAQFKPFLEQGSYQEDRYWSEVGHRWWDRERRTKPDFWNDPTWNVANRPVVGVSWYEAEAYCNWLNERLELPRGTIRLPTEAEWEWAACGPERRRYPWGDQWEAWRCNGVELDIKRTSAVGSFPGGAAKWWQVIWPDGGVVHDLAGNVWEWTASAYSGDYSKAGQTVMNTNYGGPCVLRGGSWLSEPDWVRGAARGWFDPRSWVGHWGFRLARTLSP